MDPANDDVRRLQFRHLFGRDRRCGILSDRWMHPTRPALHQVVSEGIVVVDEKNHEKWTVVQCPSLSLLFRHRLSAICLEVVLGLSQPDRAWSKLLGRGRDVIPAAVLKSIAPVIQFTITRPTMPLKRFNSGRSGFTLTNWSVHSLTNVS